MQAASNNLADMAHPGWEAELALRFVIRDGRTVLGERRHRGPLQVQRVFYPEGTDLCHLYVLHPPGGLVAGPQAHRCQCLAVCFVSWSDAESG